MSESEAGSDRGRPDRGEPDGESGRIAELLTELADDPAAPPSSVTAMSVIAAARAAAAAGASDNPVEPGDPAAPDQPADPEAPARSAEVIEFRPRRRRFALAGLVAAASLAGISALVISLTISGGSSTSTSADGARAASAESAGAFESAAAAVQPPAALPAEPSAAAPQAAGDADAAAGGAQDNSAAAAESAAAGSGQEVATSAAGCWPALSDPALGALTDVLPPGAFGSPLPLTADCEPGAVGGVILPGTAQGTVLVVRVSAAEPGACMSDTSLGTSCVARGDNVYVAKDESGAPVVVAYGSGDQVVVSGWPGAGDSVALPSGMTVEQSVVAAQAVLGAIG